MSKVVKKCEIVKYKAGKIFTTHIYYSVESGKQLYICTECHISLSESYLSCTFLYCKKVPDLYCKKRNLYSCTTELKSTKKVRCNYLIFSVFLLKVQMYNHFPFIIRKKNKKIKDSSRQM